MGFDWFRHLSNYYALFIWSETVVSMGYVMGFEDVAIFILNQMFANWFDTDWRFFASH